MPDAGRVLTGHPQPSDTMAVPQATAIGWAVDGDTQHGETVRTEADETPGQLPEEAPEPPGPAAPHRDRRRLLLWILVPLAALSLFLVFLVAAVAGVRDDLVEARSAMERGREQLLDGEATEAAASFAEGRKLFAAAEDRVGGPILRPVTWLPVLGRTLDAVSAMGSSGATAAEAAGVLAEAVADLPGGLEALSPSGGRIPVEQIPALAEAAAEADVLMTSAEERLAASPDSLLIGPVAPARRDAEEQLGDLQDTVHSAAGVLGGLPEFLGADGPRRYFFGAQNPAELRGTGGLIGAYSILTIDDGRFRFSPFSSIYRLPSSPLGELPPPNEDFAENYNQFRGGGRFWSAINVMPDFPTVAQAVLTAYEAATGETLDGAIVADPFALAALLETAGPVDLPGYDVQIDAESVVPFTTNEAYSLLTDSSARKRVLGDVARIAFERFIASSPSLDDLERVLDAGADRHIQIYSTDPAMQEALASTSAGGTLALAGADRNFASVVVNSAAGSKVDFYQQRTIDVSTLLREDGSASTTTEVVLHNRAPSSGQPAYVIGPFKFASEPGESIALLHVYCGVDCYPGQATLDGVPVETNTRVDLGMRYVQHYFPIPSKEKASFEVSWEEPEAWEGNSSGGVYRMTFANQVTIRPAAVSVRIEPPPGMEIVDASDGMQVIDGAAIYEGVPGARLDLEVAFSPPLTVRWWRNVTRFLTTPVIDL